MDIPTASKNIYPCESHELLEAVQLLADPVYIIFYLSVFTFSHIIFCLLVSVV